MLATRVTLHAHMYVVTCFNQKVMLHLDLFWFNSIMIQQIWRWKSTRTVQSIYIWKKRRNNANWTALFISFIYLSIFAFLSFYIFPCCRFWLKEINRPTAQLKKEKNLIIISTSPLKLDLKPNVEENEHDFCILCSKMNKKKIN